MPCLVSECVSLILKEDTEVDAPPHAVRIVWVEISGGAGDADGDISVQVCLNRTCHGFGAFGGINTVLMDDGGVYTDENFGLIQIRYVSAGKNGGGTFGIGDQRGNQAGCAAFHRGNGRVRCNKLFDDSVNV